jgi:hypothetical protein
MADVAQLGLAVQSDQVTAATAALNKLTAASASAQTATEKLVASTGRSESQVRAISSAAQRLGVSFDEMAKRVDAAGNAHNKLGVAQAAAQKAMVNLSAQSKTAANDNTNLQKSNDTTTGSLERLANTLTRRVLFAFAAKEVRDFAQYVWNLNAAIAATADSAQRSSIGGQQFQGLSTAAAFKGINSDTFNSAMVAFNQQVELAKRPRRPEDASDPEREDRQRYRNDLRRCRRHGEKRGVGSGKILDSAAGWASGHARIRKTDGAGRRLDQEAGEAAGKLTSQQLEDAKRIDEAWQRGWTNFENWGKRAVVNTFTAASTIWSRGFGANPDQNMGANALRSGAGTTLTSSTDVSSFYKGLGPSSSANKPTVDPNILRQQVALEQQRLGLLGPLATAEDVVKQKQLDINSAALQNVHISSAQAESLKLVALAQFEVAKVNQQAAIGVFDLNKATKALNDQLQAQIAQGLLDPKNPAQYAAATTAAAKSLEQLSDQAKVAGAPLEQLQRLTNEVGSTRTQLDQFATTSANAITPALRDMFNGTTTLSQGFRNLGITIVNALTDAIIKLTIIKPLLNSLGGSLGGLFGIAGGTASLATDGIGGFGPTFAAAAGGTFGPGWGVVGEMGPELIKVHAGAVTVIPNHVSRPYLPGFAAGGMLSAGGNVSRFPSGGATEVNIQQTFKIDGAVTQKDIVTMIRAANQASAKEVSKQISDSAPARQQRYARLGS